MIPLSLEIRILIVGGLLLVLMGVGEYAHHRVYTSGEVAGEAKIQKQWNVDKAEIQKTADEAVAKAKKDRDAALKANEDIHAQYEQKLADDLANAAVLAQRLRDATTRLAANRSAAVQAGGQPAIVTASTAPSDGGLTSAVAAVFAECNANSDQLDALIAEIKPQL